MYGFDGARIFGAVFRVFSKIFKFLWKLGVIWPIAAIWFSQFCTSTFKAVLLVIAGFLGFFLHWINYYMSRKEGRRYIFVYEMLKKIGIDGLKGSKLQKGTSRDLSGGDTEPTGIILGKDKDKYLQQTVEEAGSLAIFGTAGTGKSEIIKSTLLAYGSDMTDRPIEEQPSICCVDVKGELLQSSYNYRHNVMGRRIKYLSFNGERIVQDEAPSKYDPFSIIDFVENEIQGMTEIAQSLIVLSPEEKDPHWKTEAQSLLAGLMYSMHKTAGLTFVEALREVCSKSVDKLIEQYCIGSGTVDEPDCLDGWMILSSFYDASKSDSNEFRSVVSTMLNPLRLLVTNRSIIDSFDVSSGSILTPEDLMTGDVYLCIKEQYIGKDKPNILNLIINQFLSYLSRGENNTTKRILFILDEYPRLGKLPIMDGINLYRSKGLRFYIAAQSIAQIKETYGENGMDMLADGCAKMLVLRAAGNSAEYFSRRVGKYDKMVKSTSGGFQQQQLSFGSSVSSGSSTTEQERDIFRPAFFENELARDHKVFIFAADGYRLADSPACCVDPILSARV